MRAATSFSLALLLVAVGCGDDAAAPDAGQIGVAAAIGCDHTAPRW